MRTAVEVAAMTRSGREARVRVLVNESRQILREAIEDHITGAGRELAGVVTLFSGGNDSTVLAHIFRKEATHAAHANTGIGIEESRQFVRDTCKAWDLPLIERMAPRDVDRYVALVLERGFPGPGQHFKMYQRLKERALEQVRRELVSNGHRQRVVFLAGRRRDESARRAEIPIVERRDATVWVSPLAGWTKLDLNTYRLLQGDVPTNRVSDLIHMSGECLCGAFAKPGELAELEYWFPVDVSIIRSLEAQLVGREDIPLERRTWGWGAYRKVRPSAKTGALCSSCDDRLAVSA